MTKSVPKFCISENRPTDHIGDMRHQSDICKKKGNGIHGEYTESMFATDHML